MDEELESSIFRIDREAFRFECPECGKEFVRLQRGALESNIENHMEARH